MLILQISFIPNSWARSVTLRWCIRFPLWLRKLSIRINPVVKVGRILFPIVNILNKRVSFIPDSWRWHISLRRCIRSSGRGSLLLCLIRFEFVMNRNPVYRINLLLRKSIFTWVSHGLSKELTLRESILEREYTSQSINVVVPVILFLEFIHNIFIMWWFLLSKPWIWERFVKFWRHPFLNHSQRLKSSLAFRGRWSVGASIWSPWWSGPGCFVNRWLSSNVDPWVNMVIIHTTCRCIVLTDPMWKIRPCMLPSQVSWQEVRVISILSCGIWGLSKRSWSLFKDIVSVGVIVRESIVQVLEDWRLSVGLVMASAVALVVSRWLPHEKSKHCSRWFVHL